MPVQIYQKGWVHEYQRKEKLLQKRSDSFSSSFFGYIFSHDLPSMERASYRNVSGTSYVFKKRIYLLSGVRFLCCFFAWIAFDNIRSIARDEYDEDDEG